MENIAEWLAKGWKEELSTEDKFLEDIENLDKEKVKEEKVELFY